MLGEDRQCTDALAVRTLLYRMRSETGQLGQNVFVQRRELFETYFRRVFSAAAFNVCALITRSVITTQTFDQ